MTRYSTIPCSSASTITGFRLVSLCLFLPFFFSACSAPTGNPNAKTLRFAHTITGGAAKDVIDGVVKAFEKKHTDLRVEQITMSDDVYEDMGLISLFQGKNPPDVYFQWGGWLVERDARDNRAADLTEFLNRDQWREDFLPLSWTGSEWNGRTYMIPYMIQSSVVLWYNQKLFEQMNASVPSSWEEFLRTCEAAKQAGIVPIALGNKELWPLGNWAAHILSRVIGEAEYAKLFRYEEGASFSQPGAVRALAVVQDLARKGFFQEGMPTLEDEEGQSYFRTERALYHPIGNWVIPIWEKEASQLRYDGLNTPPLADGLGDQTSVLGLVSGFLVYKNTPIRAEAVEFLRDLSSLEAQQRFVAVGQYSPHVHAYDGEVDPHLKRIMDILNQTRTVVPPPDTGFNVSVADAFYGAVQAVAGGRSTPEEALQEADREARRHRR